MKTVKGSLVLIVGSNKAVFLKDWQVKAVHQWFDNEGGINSFLIKLNRNYFKIYEFQNDFDDFEGMDDNNFDDLKKIAQMQTDNFLKVAKGHI